MRTWSVGLGVSDDGYSNWRPQIVEVSAVGRPFGPLTGMTFSRKGMSPRRNAGAGADDVAGGCGAVASWRPLQPLPQPVDER